MSNKYKQSSDIPTSVLIERLMELSDAVTKGNVSEFYMRVPAELDRDADLVLQEAAERLKNTEWQPIETARFLDDNDNPILMMLYAPHEMGGYIFVGCFVNGKWADNLHCATDHKPTHWQPLPQPPNDLGDL